MIAARLPEAVHIVGVCGSGTSGLARILHSRGVQVSGSDTTATELRSLRLAGIPVVEGHHRENLRDRVELVVHSAAIPSSNPELIESRRRGVEVLKYAQFLGRMVDSSFGIAVAGTHGKTTTAAMLASVWIAAGREPTVLLGGRHPELDGNWHSGGGSEFVVEACEYDRSFHSIHPQAGIVTNLELDHPDVYSDLDSVLDSFGKFVEGFQDPGVLVLGVDRAGARALQVPTDRPVFTFGYCSDADWRAAIVECGPNPVFEVLFRGRSYGRFRLRVAGPHNVLNALAVVALADALGIDRESIVEGLERFPGVDRRFERLGRHRGVDWIDDFAHHPTELSSAIETAREVFAGRRLWVLFQPHQYGRLRTFGPQFAESLAAADGVGLLPVYSVRESIPVTDGSSLLTQLVTGVERLGTPVEQFDSFDDAEVRLPHILREDDVCLACGAGDLSQLTARFVAGSTQ